MSSDKDPKKQVVDEIIASAKENPDVKAAGRNLAKAAKTVTEFINIALLPLSAANWGVERARKYFEGDFQSEFEPYVSDIPMENIKEPPGGISGPALQGIAWSLDSEVLKDMFMRLLASAMDSRKDDVSHPAFVRVIQQLSPEEADLLNKTFERIAPNSALPVARLKVVIQGEPGWHEPLKHIAPVLDENKEPSRNANIPLWLDNWARLGVVEIRYDIYMEPVDKQYEWVTQRPEYLEIKNELKEGEQIEVVRGLVRLTAFGIKLSEALK